MVAGMVAERVTGQSWEDFTRARIMNPLGMINVGFSSEDLERVKDSARPYVMADDEPGVFVRKRAPLWPIRDTPAGGINAAISDMASYLGFYLADGRFNGADLLSPATLRALQTPRVHSGRSEFEEVGDHHYGFGFATHHYRGERVVSHSGGWIGWGTLMTMLPARRFGAVILTNRAPSPVTDIIAFAVFDRLCGKEPIPWLDRFRTRRREAIAQRTVDLKAHRATRKLAAPSRPLAEYAGDYQHPGYGRITIEAVGDALHWQFHGLSGALNHRHYDVFEVPENPVMLSPDRLPVTFAYDREGNIDRLSVPFESMVADIVFTRVAAGDALDPTFRAACVGSYQCGPAKHVVALDANGQLTLSPTNQPTYRLIPYRDRTFTIEELTGFRVEFRCDEAGVVKTIVFHQPNGTFLGQRVSD
jgi:hypothetical protein